MKKFSNVSLKTPLVEEIKKFIQGGNRYRSVAEFVAEAARLRLERLEELQRKGGKKDAS